MARRLNVSSHSSWIHFFPLESWIGGSLLGDFFRSKNLPKELPLRHGELTRRKKKKISCHFQFIRLTGKAFIVLGRLASLRLRRCISTKGHWFFVEPVLCGVAAGAAPPHLYWFCVFESEHRGPCRQSHIHPVILKVSIFYSRYFFGGDCLISGYRATELQWS